MTRTVSFIASLAIAAAPVPVLAQDAAETAIILGGTGQAQGRAQRSLGQAISHGMGNAANAVAATNAARARAQSRSYRQQARRSGGRGAGKFAIALPADVDPLDRTDAPRYELANGATIRVSGGLRRPLATTADLPPED